MKTLAAPGQPRYATDGYAMEMGISPLRSPDAEVRMTRPTTDNRSPSSRRDDERELARTSAATRRTVVLGGLVLILFVTLVLAVLAIVPRWAPIVAAVPVIAFVLASALTASSRSAVRQRPASRPVHRSAAAEPAKVVAADAVADDWETWNAWDDADSWEAVPTTLPTYVTAPRASAVPRGIDRSRPGEWTGSAMVEEARAMRSRQTTDPLLRPEAEVDHGAMTAELPAITESQAPRRAVNE